MISIKFVTIGIADTKIKIFPASKILFAILVEPASTHKFAENSVMYPTPIIFKTAAKIPVESPLF